MPEVLVRRARYPVPAAVVEEILERFAPPLEGRRVLVKPNCLMAAAPERGVTTHPSLVREVVAGLRRRGAVVAVGDNPGARGYGAAREAFVATGLLEAADGAYEEIGGRTAHAPIRFGRGERVIVSAAVLEADWVVSLPKLKTHCLTVLTGAVKNCYGYLAGAEKARLHREAPTAARFAEAVAAVFEVRPPDLAIMDAVVAMEGDGPSHGPLREVGLVLASDDAVALDATAARAVGLDPLRVGHLAVAAGRGRGAIDAGEIRVDGELRGVPRLRLPSSFRAGLMTALSNLVVFNLLHRSRLQVDVRKCQGCGACVDACPVGAVGPAAEGVAIDQARCQLCFCCAELCPEGAVETRGALGALVNRRTGSVR